MMNCCQCQGIEEQFDEKTVFRELTLYRTKGPEKTTRMLIDALKAAGIQGLSLLDIGGGVGAVQHGLLEAGVQNATDVDASHAYLNAAKAEAQRRGLSERVSFQHGNFVDIAAQIPPADIVTLDRVICCYPDMEKLVSLSAARARKLIGLVYPRHVWWVRTGISVLNFLFRLGKNRFRTFSHPTRGVEAIINHHGFKHLFYGQTFVWQVVVFSHE
jgi:2-polyprenyl-3-methyl-5-hydroxy-6-metoxy-1,4-benzoquinol methylase